MSTTAAAAVGVKRHSPLQFLFVCFFIGSPVACTPFCSSPTHTLITVCMWIGIPWKINSDQLWWCSIECKHCVQHTQMIDTISRFIDFSECIIYKCANVCTCKIRNLHLHTSTGSIQKPLAIWTFNRFGKCCSQSSNSLDCTSNGKRKLKRKNGIVWWQHNYNNGIKWHNLNDICLLISK